MAKRGGKREGSGRPAGTKNPETLLREEVLKEYRQRVLKASDVLFNSQMSLARGNTYLYKIEKYYEGTGKKRILKRKKPKLVETQWEIEDYLTGITEDHELEEKGDTYYFLTTKTPSVKAQDSMLDRAFGKAMQAIDLTSKGESIKTNTIIVKDFSSEDEADNQS